MQRGRSAGKGRGLVGSSGVKHKRRTRLDNPATCYVLFALAPSTRAPGPACFGLDWEPPTPVNVQRNTQEGQRTRATAVAGAQARRRCRARTGTYDPSHCCGQADPRFPTPREEVPICVVGTAIPLYPCRDRCLSMSPGRSVACTGGRVLQRAAAPALSACDRLLSCVRGQVRTPDALETLTCAS